MKCCGRPIPRLELQVRDQPYVLYRCGECDTTYWERDGEPVAFDAIAPAMRGDAAPQAKAQQAGDS